MTLWRLALAFGPLAALFVIFARLSRGSLPAPAVLMACAEALVLTLLAALWFGSLGRGGWVTLFLLLGVLVGGSGGLSGRRFAFDLARYLLAGALLAWRLG